MRFFLESNQIARLLAVILVIASAFPGVAQSTTVPLGNLPFVGLIFINSLALWRRRRFLEYTYYVLMYTSMIQFQSN